MNATQPVQSTELPPALKQLMGNIVYDPCALSLGKLRSQRTGHQPFCPIPEFGDGQLRHQQMLRSERIRAGGY